MGTLSEQIEDRPFLLHAAWALPWSAVGGVVVHAIDRDAGHAPWPAPLITLAFLALVAGMNACGVWITRLGSSTWNRTRMMAWYLPPGFVLLPLLLS